MKIEKLQTAKKNNIRLACERRLNHWEKQWLRKHLIATDASLDMACGFKAVAFAKAATEKWKKRIENIENMENAWSQFKVHNQNVWLKKQDFFNNT